MSIQQSAAWPAALVWLALLVQPGGRGTKQEIVVATQPIVHLTSEQDHQRIMDLLHMQTIRQVRSGSPSAPNYANYDESKTNPFLVLPDTLVLNNGKRVTTAQI